MKHTKDNPESRTFLVTVTRTSERSDGSWKLSDSTDEKKVQQHLTGRSYFNDNARVEVVVVSPLDQEEML